MMARKHQDGMVIDYTNNGAETIFYGAVVTLGTKIGIALETIPAGAVGSVGIEGIYEMESDTGTAFAVGDIVYVGTGNQVTKTAGDIAAGWVVYPKDAAAATAYVKINAASIPATSAADTPEA